MKPIAKNVECMTAGQINKALDRLEKRSSELNAEFVAAGRGEERISEICKKSDPLALRHIQISKEICRLRMEIAERYGPGAP